MNDFRLPDATRIGRVDLRVADVGRVLGFYRDVLGLRVIPGEVAPIQLSPTGEPPALLALSAAAGAPRRPPHTTGLYHFALLVPKREELGRALLRLADTGWPLQGASDHAVSEALYLADPEDNGIEIYADRPRERWRRSNGEVFMTTEPLDISSLVRAAGTAPPVWPTLAPGTTVGHIHLNVSDLGEAEAFYHRLLGLDVVTRRYPGALFLSAGGYHHHVGLNIWAGAGAPRPPAGATGLIQFELIVPDAATREQLAGRLEAAGRPLEPIDGGLRVVDPDGIGIVIDG